MRGVLWVALVVAMVAIGGCTRQAPHEGANWTSDYDATEVPADGGATASSDTTRFYEGRKSVKLTYDRGACSLPICGGETGVARGLYEFGSRSVAGYEGYFGAAFYLPSDFYSRQTGYIELFRWDNAGTLDGSADKGAIAIFADHRARLVRGAVDAGEEGVEVIGTPFDIPVGQWADIYVHQRMRGAATPAPGREGINDVYVNGERVLHAGNVQNSAGNGYDRLLYGLVYNSATELGTDFQFWFDRAYASSEGPPAPSRPNVLFIVTDDQRSDGTLRTDVMPETLKWFRDGAPGIDGGTQFENGYVTTPLCCPSRSSIFSGRYVHNHGVRDNTTVEAGHLDQETMLPKYLQDDDYQTGIYGKYLNGWRIYRDPPHFDKWGTHEEQYGATAANPSGTFRLNDQGTFRGQNEYSVDFVSRKGQEFIEAAESDDSRPWFLYLSVAAPHGPADPPERYSAANLPRNQLPDFLPHQNSRNEADISDKPPGYRTWTDPVQIFDQTNPGTGQLAEGLSTKMLRTLRAVDDMVSGVMGKLRDLGEEKDTLAVFVSDNGFHWREHGVASQESFSEPGAQTFQPQGTGLSRKGQPYIESVKVPFFMRWPHNPRLQKNVVDDRLVANIDLAPTVLDAIGREPSQQMDGISLLRGARRDRLLLENFRDDANPWASTLTDSYHYTEYYGPDGVEPQLDGGQPVREYYDLRNDPYEMTNLLQDGDPSNDPDVSVLSARLQRDRFCVGSECPPGSGAPADHTDPVARITSPPNGAFVTGTVPIVVDATDNVGVDRVTFTADGVTNTDDSYPYEFSWNPAAAGSQTISATAYDAADRSSAASEVTVDVDGFDVDVVPGNTDHKISSGDRLRFTYPRPVDPGSLAMQWALRTPPLIGSDAITVSVDVHGDAGGPPFINDTISISGTSSNAFGTIDLGDWSYAASLGANPSFTSSKMTMPDAQTVEIQLQGGAVGAAAQAAPRTTMLWSMGSARDSTGTPFCATPPCIVGESGSPPDRDFY